MKAVIFALALLAAGSTPTFAQTTLANWTFETSLPSTAGTFAPEIGAGYASGLHVGAATYSSPVGNGSAHSFSSTAWAVGDYYQFQTSTTGSSGIKVSWDQISSNTGPKNFNLSYSTDGSSFTQFAPYSVLANASPNAWASGTTSLASGISFDLSALTALDNATAVYFRLIDAGTVSANGGTVASAGTDRVDNFTITAIPEPSTYALILGSAGFAGVLLLRRRRFAATL